MPQDLMRILEYFKQAINADPPVRPSPMRVWPNTYNVLDRLATTCCRLPTRSPKRRRPRSGHRPDDQLAEAHAAMDSYCGSNSIGRAPNASTGALSR